jgi:DNA-binding XRE family transcriptional regulator
LLLSLSLPHEYRKKDNRVQKLLQGFYEMNIMTTKDDITDISLEMDNLYGKAGTPEREQFRREAYAYCMGQIIHDARKSEKITQAELANRIGTDKSYISKIEKGLVEPGVGTFYRIIDALGLRVEIVKPIY